MDGPKTAQKRPKNKKGRKKPSIFSVKYKFLSINDRKTAQKKKAENFHQIWRGRGKTF